jgi:hypothetical protein
VGAILFGALQFRLYTLVITKWVCMEGAQWFYCAMDRVMLCCSLCLDSAFSIEQQLLAPGLSHMQKNLHEKKACVFITSDP